MALRFGSSNVKLRLGDRAASRLYRGPTLVWEPTATPAEPVFDPLKLAPASWWDAADASTIDLLDGRVNRMRDKSGNGRQLLTTSASKQPLYTASDDRIRGKPSVSATRSGDILLTQNDATASVSYVVKEIYVVAQFADGLRNQFNVTNIGWGDGYTALIAGGGANGNPRLMGNINSAFWIQTSNLAPGTFRNRDTVIGGDATQRPILPLPLSVLRIQVTSQVGAQSRAIGNQDAGAVRAWNGPWCECLMFDGVLSETDRNALVEHLIAKWGIIV